MTKFGGGVNKFEVDLLQGPPFGLHQQHLAQSEHSLLGSHHAAFEHDKVIGHLTIVDKATLGRSKVIGSAQIKHEAVARSDHAHTLVLQPHTILRVVSWVFSIVVFGSIVNEGYLNSPSESEEFCIYNRNPNACGYGVTVGVLAFLTCLLYLALDVYFPQISSVKDRKKAVLSDIGVSAFWAFLWFVGFCFLANQWQVSEPKDNPLNEGTDAARAAIAFSFFSIFTWSLTAALAVRRFKDLTFQEEYNTLFPASAQP
uniref:MARVEL domain-containing protein n=1 Tax=Capra hircus TaxID=9925 RepID=A0A8C2NNX0_CAPHI